MSEKSSSVRRALRVVLMADEFIVAESKDERLWRSVLDAVYRNDPAGAAVDVPQDLEPRVVREREDRPADADGALAAFADDIGVSIDDLRGACRPTINAPYIRLDHRHWEALKKQTPERGPRAVGPVVLAGTLLALWARHAEIPPPTVGAAQDVLKTISARDKNPYRGLKNCEWLQMDGGAIVLHPAHVSRASLLARQYCTKHWGVTQ